MLTTQGLGYILFARNRYSPKYKSVIKIPKIIAKIAYKFWYFIPNFLFLNPDL